MKLTAQEWATMALSVQAGDNQAATELYHFCSHALRPSLLESLGPNDLEDNIHEVYIIVLKRLRAGEVYAPESLESFVFRVADNYTIGRKRLAERRPLIHNLPGGNRDFIDPSLSPEERLLVAEYDRLRRRAIVKYRFDKRRENSANTARRYHENKNRLAASAHSLAAFVLQKAA